MYEMIAHPSADFDILCNFFLNGFKKDQLKGIDIFFKKK